MTTTRLYRVENPNIEVDPGRFGDTSHPELVGQWFTPDLDQATNYIKKSTQIFEKKARVVDGAQMLVADIANGDLSGYLASGDERTRNMDIEGDNYLLPRDGTVSFSFIALDAILGELRGNMHFDNLLEARRRIEEAVKNLPINS
jgi:hypothetical protein